MDTHGIHFSKTYMATSFWFVSRMRCIVGRSPEHSQHIICNVLGCSEVGMRKAMLIILQTLGMSIDQLKMLTVKEFISGIKYE